MEALTYEDIYELLRSEKNSTDLEPLSTKDLAKINKYLIAKRKLLESQKGGMFSGLKERAKILSEIENVRCALRDLFEKRECKIINRALYTLRTDLKLKDSTNMLANEIELYNSLLGNLEKSKLAFDKLLEESTLPDSIAADAVSKEETKDAVASSMKLEFLDTVPELVDAELAKHGPFEKGNVASLPNELASILISQGKAKAQ